MKKVNVISMLIMFTTSVIYAQSTPGTEKTEPKPGSGQTPVKKGATLRQIPPAPPPPSSAPAPPPPPRTPPTSTTNKGKDTPTPIYSLTSIRVRIRTGNDNKEFPSKVLVTMMPKNVADWNTLSQYKLDNEMRTNSDTEFGLELNPRLTDNPKLEAYQSQGIRLNINYRPNFFTDAWKIENVTIVLEFKDQFGNLHPTLGSKTIVFDNAYGFLNNEYRSMDCYTDASFVPITAMIGK